MEGAAYTPNEPCRLLDTRRTDERVADRTWRVDVGGRCGIGNDIGAVALTVTAANPTAAGHLTIYPAGTARPATSNVNYTRGGAVANTVIVAVSDETAVDVYAHTETDVVVDVNGTFADAAGPVAAGRLVPVPAVRIADTRRPEQFPSVQSDSSGHGGVKVPLPAGVPTDAVAVAVSLVAISDSHNHLTVHAANSPRPTASVLNTDDLNVVRATTVFVPVDEDGFVVFRARPADVLVDLLGYFTGPSATVSTDGLFVAEKPTRLWDSRRSHDPLFEGGRVTRQVAGANASVAALNVTAVAPTRRGHVSVGPAGSARPVTSSVNFEWRHPVAAATLAENTTAGVTFWANESAGTHLVVDRYGWFTGTASDAVAEADANSMRGAGGQVLFVSDSSFAGIRWTGALELLQGATFDNRLESCRRLIGVSCNGREGYAPPTAFAEVESVADGVYDTAVIGTGYNDWDGRFEAGFDAVMAAARRAGIRQVVWLTYREPVTYTSPSAASSAATFAANNHILRSKLSSGRWPELVLADWNAHSAGRDSWTTSDGVHFTVEGAREAAMFLSRTLASLDRRPCPAGIGGHSTDGGWCADPTGR